MKYEFKAGDFVELSSGYVGWIREIKYDYETMYFHIYCDIPLLSHDYDVYCLGYKLPNYFRRIGTYDFTESKHPEKIEKLPYGKTEKRLCNMVKCYSDGTKEESKNTETDVFVKTDIVGVIKKLNEVIDRVNEIGDSNE